MNHPNRAYREHHHEPDSRARPRTGLCIALAATLALSAGCGMSRPDRLGLDTGRLAPCPDAPHCVCSEFSEASTTIAPLSFTEDPPIAWRKAVEAVQTIGGSIVTQQDDYLHATFTTRFLRFVDDLELRLEADTKVIHVRSSSRIGYYDFNVNRKRVERLRDAFAG